MKIAEYFRVTDFIDELAIFNAARLNADAAFRFAEIDAHTRRQQKRHHFFVEQALPPVFHH